MSDKILSSIWAIFCITQDTGGSPQFLASRLDGLRLLLFFIVLNKIKCNYGIRWMVTFTYKLKKFLQLYCIFFVFLWFVSNLSLYSHIYVFVQSFFPIFSFLCLCSIIWNGIDSNWSASSSWYDMLNFIKRIKFKLFHT